MPYDEYDQEPAAEDGLLRKARMGMEAERFFGSNVGRLILAEAEKRIEVGYKALSLVDPDDPKKVRAYQFSIAVARAVPEWLQTVIRDGHEAARVIRQEDDELGG